MTTITSRDRTAAPPHLRTTLCVCGVLLVLAASAAAHHSIAGVYDNQRPVTIDGTVTEYRFVSPHPYLDVRDSRTSQVWRLEMDNRGELSSIGVDEQTFRAGDRLIVTGSPARRGGNQMYIERLERPADGFAYDQVNSRPRLRQRSR